MTQQEAFDKVWNHFVRDKAPFSAVMTGALHCQYRGPNGEKCAYGLFIPDDLYDPVFETKRASYIEDNHHFAVLSGSFLDSLQNCHDDSCVRLTPPFNSRLATPEEFLEKVTERLCRLAKEHNLKIPRKRK